MAEATRRSIRNLLPGPLWVKVAALLLAGTGVVLLPLLIDDAGKEPSPGLVLCIGLLLTMLTTAALYTGLTSNLRMHHRSSSTPSPTT